MKYFVVVVILVLLTGCVGKIYTVVDPKPDSNGRIEGVIVYQPRALMVEYKTTHLQDKNGNIIGSSAEGSCHPISSYEITYAPDYGKKYAILYEAAIFESNTFTLDLDKGVLTKLNSVSTSGAKEALDVVQGIIGTAKEIAGTIPKKIEEPKGPPCNVGKDVVRLRNLEDILK